MSRTNSHAPESVLASHIPEETVRLASHQEEVDGLAHAVLFEGSTQVETLVAYAATHNPEIAAARSQAEALIWRVPQARALDDPLLSSTVFLEEIQTAGGPQDVILRLSQKLPWFGKRDARGAVAYHEAQVAYADLADVELRVVEQVKLAYFELFFISRAIGIYEELKPKLEDLIEVTRTRYETDAKNVGLESVLQAEVALHKLHITLAELEQARLKAGARLAKAIHLPCRAVLDIQPQLRDTSLPPEVGRLVAMVEHCHPQLESRRQAVARDDWSAALAARDYYPDVNVGFNWHAIGTQGLSPVANGQDAYAITLGVNLPVYQAKREAAVQQALFESVRSGQQYDATWDSLRAQVETLHATAVEQDRVLQILNQDILRKARQTFDLSLEAYRVGRIGFQQLIDNYEDLLRFRLDHDLRRTRRAQAVAQLERVVGCAVAQWPLESAQPPNNGQQGDATEPVAGR